MDGWRRSNLRTCGRVGGWSHEPPPAPGEALCCQNSTAENFLFFFASHECARGANGVTYEQRQGDGERVKKPSLSVLDPGQPSQLRSSATAQTGTSRDIDPATLTGWAVPATPSFAKPSLINQIVSTASAPPRLRAPRCSKRTMAMGDASMAPRAVDRLRLLHVLAPHPLPGLSQCPRAATFYRTGAAGRRTDQLPYAA